MGVFLALAGIGNMRYNCGMAKDEGGRPTKYNKDFSPLLAEALALSGMTDKQIAKKMGITEATLNNWKKKYPEFFESLKRGKECPDDLVEDSLFKRATGCKTKEVIREKNRDTKEMEVTREVIKQIPPDPTSMIFWLKNRRPDRWRDKPSDETKDETINRLLEIVAKVTGQ